MFSFSVLFEKRKFVFQSCINTTFSPPPLPSPLLSCEFHPGALRQNLAGLAEGGVKWAWLGPCLGRLATKHILSSHLGLPYHTLTFLAVHLPYSPSHCEGGELRDRPLWVREHIFKHNWHSLKKRDRWTQMI